MKKPFYFLMRFFKRQPAPTNKKYAVEQMLEFVRNSRSMVELEKIQFILELCKDDYTNTEFVKISSEILYQRLLFATLKAEFPHDYYPPFSMLQHINTATSYVKVDAIYLHLMVYIDKYSIAQLTDFATAIDARKEQLLILTENRYDTAI